MFKGQKNIQSSQGKNWLELAFNKLGSYEVALVNRHVLLHSFLGETFLEFSILRDGEI